MPERRGRQVGCLLVLTKVHVSHRPTGKRTNAIQAGLKRLMHGCGFVRGHRHVLD